MAFCEKLNAAGKAPEGWKFTLPTEAQWEYAARGGKKGQEVYKTYSGSNNMEDVGWYYENSGKERLQDSLSKYVKETALMVKLSNFDLTILGEVTRPGKYKVYQSEIGIFEALALAGSFTNFAKTETVKIVRHTDDGSEVVTVDVGKADILSSPYYYLKPNDIIYVEPLKFKQWGFTSFPYSTVLSVMSLGVTMVTLYLNMKKN